MNQKLTLNIEEDQLHFLLHHKNYGFKDEAEMIKVALQKLQSELEAQDLQESAQLYAEIYEEDAELQELTETACAYFKET
ncbi:MAG: hypothetical protein F6K23_19980 [Okeania sp. SIO2C9]|uniref:hypothetical protein n=1 Tax=Okeania sp. SIO2C9 TaxID=2607791 RepID=UPI0013BFEE4D|nr:hypothetical protein [Okeania sp. SIO2C9]NEQ75120.1 hypothetical protein [Okeania sp. SIO2C9]